jgi:uncharacterized membrane protein YqaE (UPF0057 family)
MRKLFLFVLSFTLLVSVPASSAMILPGTARVSHPGEPTKEDVKNALNGWKQLSHKEKRSRYKQARSEFKAFKAARKAGKDADSNTILLAILAILLPPLAVFLYEGEINNRFWISLLLTIIFWVPGVIYALILILGGN